MSKQVDVAIIGGYLDASNLISEGAILFKLGLKLEDVAETIHPHPSLSEGMGILAKQMLAQING